MKLKKWFARNRIKVRGLALILLAEVVTEAVKGNLVAAVSAVLLVVVVVLTWKK